MDSKARYFIIALLVVVFIVLSPLILLYVTGRTLPFFDPSPTNTGIIDVQSEPDGATVFLNEQEAGSTPTTIRFVKQGWQTVRVTMEGFRPWQKQLFIEAGEVTYAGSINDAIRLLPEAEPIAIDTTINAVAMRDNQILYSKGQEIILYDVINERISNQTTLPFVITNFQATQDNNLWLVTTDQNQRYLMNSSNWQTTALPTVFNSATQISLLDSSSVTGIIDNNLVIGRFGSNQTQTLLSNVWGYTIKDGTFYVASETEATYQLATYLWTGTTITKQLVIVSEGLPQQQELKFFLTNQKELFMLAGESFYRVNQTLELLNSFVKVVELDPNSQRLTYVTPTEIFFYNFTSNRSELLARTTENLMAANVIPLFGYGFIAGPNGTEAIEIDSRGNQNRYMLYTGPSQQLFITSNQKALIVKSENNLYSVLIQR